MYLYFEYFFKIFAEKFKIKIANPSRLKDKFILIRVFHDQLIGKDFIGQCKIPFATLSDQLLHEGSLHLQDQDDNPSQGSIKIRAQWAFTVEALLRHKEDEYDAKRVRLYSQMAAKKYLIFCNSIFWCVFNQYLKQEELKSLHEQFSAVEKEINEVMELNVQAATEITMAPSSATFDIHNGAAVEKLIEDGEFILHIYEAQGLSLVATQVRFFFIVFLYVVLFEFIFCVTSFKRARLRRLNLTHVRRLRSFFPSYRLTFLRTLIYYLVSVLLFNCF